MNTQQEEGMRTHEPVLTEEQKRLADAKEILSDSLREIHTEIETITDYLLQVDSVRKVDFIKDLVRVQDELDYYLEAAENSLREYSATRKELISFADKDDIFFIPRLLADVKYRVERIQSILEQLKNEAKNKNNTFSDDAEVLTSGHLFFKYYYQRLERMWKVYENLYDAIYWCKKDEYGKRLNRQYSSISLMTESLGNLIRITIEDRERKDSPCLIYTGSEPIIIDEKKSVAIKADKAILSINTTYDLNAIDRQKEEITRRIRQIAPDLKLDEFIDRDSLAQYIHCNKILHEDANNILSGYIQLNYLENIRKELLGLVLPQEKRGRKKCECFEDLDKQMLRTLYIKIFEQVQRNICRRSKNAYAALFLIAMFRGTMGKVVEKVSAFCKLINNLIEDIKIDVRTVQDVVSKYNWTFGLKKNKINERMNKYREIVERIILDLENTGLILG